MTVNVILISSFLGLENINARRIDCKNKCFHQHTEGISQQSLSRDFKPGKATIERWYGQGYAREYKERESVECPEVLGIDEHFFSKKTRLCDDAV